MKTGLDSEILARIRAAISLNEESKFSDFQVRVGKNGSVLVNMKTGRTQVIYDELSVLHDLEDLGIAEIDDDKPINEEYW